MNQLIETKRCFLRPAADSDKFDIYGLYKNIQVRQFLGGTVSETEFAGRFPEIISNPGRNWVVRLKNDQFIGLLNIDQHHDQEDQEMSYQFLPEFWHQGFAEEACRKMMVYASEEMKLASIVAETQSANISSRNLLEKLGMAPETKLLRYGAEQLIYRKKL